MAKTGRASVRNLWNEYRLRHCNPIPSSPTVKFLLGHPPGSLAIRPEPGGLCCVLSTLGSDRYPDDRRSEDFLEGVDIAARFGRQIDAAPDAAKRRAPPLMPGNLDLEVGRGHVGNRRGLPVNAVSGDDSDAIEFREHVELRYDHGVQTVELSDRSVRSSRASSWRGREPMDK